MVLLKIQSVCVRPYPSSGRIFNEIRFEGAKLAVTNYHCFLTSDGRKLCSAELQVGDVIWIDWSAFTADNSIYVARAKITQSGVFVA